MKIFVKVKPNSSKQKVIFLEEENYLVELKSPPEKNKANLELIKVLSKYFNVEPKRITIKSGLNNKEKIIEIR